MGILTAVASVITIFVAGGAIASQTDISFDVEMVKDIGRRLLETVKVWTN